MSNILRRDWEGMSLSDQERALIHFTFNRFGEPLGHFLLSGLGEEGEARVWFFSVTFAGRGGAVYSREIRVEPDRFPRVRTLLPRRREPLVMVALLHLLTEDGKSSSPTLLYQQEEVLALLGWNNTAKARSSIDQAVMRYARLLYSWNLSGRELSDINLHFYEAQSRLVSGYSHRNAEESGRYKRVTNRVEFGVPSLKELAQRSLFDINWDSVSEINRRVSGP
jgi:hypothetical protein